ncbi:MAG TPA: DUF1064 domain-containing protein [Candidatus Kaiserbacteria bacterium]|nr:DUF1064 domain-containing protein [Candidatus Kaiserbacteria bacterium]
MNKYHAQKMEVDGVVFHSRKEGRRYIELKLCKHAKGNDKIIELELQPKFPCVVNGKKICTYIADFKIHYADGRVVVEDVKGALTPVYKLKKKLVEALYGIEIIET